MVRYALAVIAVLAALGSLSTVALAAPEDLIRINVAQASLDQVLRMIGKAGNVNIVIPPELAQKTVTDLRLEDIPVSEALARVLILFGYEAVLENNAYLVRVRAAGTPPALLPPLPPPSALAGQQQVEGVLPLRYADATQLAAYFTSSPSPTAAPTPPTVPLGDLDDFIKRCVAAATRDLSYSGRQGQYYLEFAPGVPSLSPEWTGRGGLSNLLPQGLTGPPQALPVTNSLRVSGTEEAVAKFKNLVSLLDKPVKRVELQVEVLPGTPQVYDKLQVSGWSHEAKRDNAPALLSFTRSTLPDLRQKLDEAGVPDRLAGTALVSNNTVAEMHLGEAWSLWWSATPAAAPVRRVAGHFLNVRLSPRANADASVTVLVEAFAVVGQTEPADLTRFAPQTSHSGWIIPIRVGGGETLALALGALSTAEGQAVGDETLLARPILLITPRVVVARP